MKHADVIQHSARYPKKKVIFLMFGGVDLDVTVYRTMCLENDFDEREFVDRRMLAYESFVQMLLTADYAAHAVCVLAPQISPLRGDAFFKQTAELAGIDERAIRLAAERYDLTDQSRNSRVLRFNDRLSESLSGLSRVYMERIDREMVGVDGAILEHFCPKNPMEHHAMNGATLNLWRPKVLEFFYGSRALPPW